MAEWLPQYWEPSLDAPTRAGRQGGRYAAYLPDALEGRPLAMGAKVSMRAAAAESAVRRLTLSPESRSLEGLARFLLRSEAIASSRIEGMKVSAQQVALAELAQTESLSGAGFSRNAQFVATTSSSCARRPRISLGAGASPSPGSTSSTEPCSRMSGTTACGRSRTGSAGTTGIPLMPNSCRLPRNGWTP